MQTLFRTSLLAYSFLCCPAFAEVCGEGTPCKSPLVAEIDGVKLTLADIERKNPAALFQARNSYYEAQRKALEEFVDQHLLEAQARKENTTVSELLERHVNSRIAKDPPDEALSVYYEGLDTKESFESIKPKIVGHLRQKRLERAKSAYMESLRAQADIAIKLAPPRAEISMKDTPVRGVPNAPVMFVEYADYECPYCQQMQPTLERLRAEYQDKVAFAYKDVPLPNHPNAQKAAEATHCAGAQGKYWEYHDVLVTAKQFELAKLKETARTLKLDEEAFDQCLDTGAQAKIVKAHLDEAQSLGLQGTPSFFINGRSFSGLIPYETLRGIVEEELAAASKEPNKTAKR